MSAIKRLISDYNQINKSPSDGVTAKPLDGDMFHWIAVILGPDESVWEGGIFKLDLKFTEDYPTRPPVVKFIGVIPHHPNIYKDGNICLSLLKDGWSASYKVQSILTSVQSLLTDPNPSSPANAVAAAEYLNNRFVYENNVKECVEKTWSAVEEAGEYVSLIETLIKSQDASEVENEEPEK